MERIGTVKPIERGKLEIPRLESGRIYWFNQSQCYASQSSNMPCVKSITHEVPSSKIEARL